MSEGMSVGLNHRRGPEALRKHQRVRAMCGDKGDMLSVLTCPLQASEQNWKSHPNTKLDLKGSYTFCFLFPFPIYPELWLSSWLMGESLAPR